MNQFLTGILAALSVVAAVFFWTFWRRTRDGLFGAFCAGFGALGLHWSLLGILNSASESRYYLYVVRFFAFALIIGGIVLKNRQAAASHGRGATGSNTDRT